MCSFGSEYKMNEVILFAVMGIFIQSSAESGMFLGGFPGIVFLLVLFLLANYRGYETPKKKE